MDLSKIYKANWLCNKRFHQFLSGVTFLTNYTKNLLSKGRVGKTEERMEMENKSMSNILSQAKQVETQLVNQQERLSSKEAQLHMQVQKMQEEVKKSSGCLSFQDNQ